MRRALALATILAATALLLGTLLPYGAGSAYAGDGTCGEASAEGSTTWYFAEGYTGEGFQEYLTLFNPQDEFTHTKVIFSDASVPYSEPVPLSLGIDQSESRPREADYPDTFELDLPPSSRITLDINTLAGKDREVSLFLESQEPITAERPMYFTYRGAWKGCTVTSGATSPSETWYFAEGCTREGFETWLLLANPGESDAGIDVLMILEDGSHATAGTFLPPHSRQTIYVNQIVGEGHDVAINVRSFNKRPICAERVMYFDYHGKWEGGHASSGLSQPLTTYHFAEGYTGAGFEEWLTLYAPWNNVGEDGTDVTLNCLFQGGEQQSFDVHLDPDTRHTLNINQLVGEGKDVSMEISAEEPFLAERPMYFNYKGVCRGGHVSKGVEAAGTHWYLAEGTTRPGFYEYLCMMNPGDENAVVDIVIDSTQATSTTLDYTVPARSRLTVDVRAVIGTGLDTSFEINSDQPIAVERPLYYPTCNFEVVNAMDNLWNLSVGIGERIEGTAGDEAAVNYLSGVLKSYGYDPAIQDVPLPNGSYTHNVIARWFPPGTPTSTAHSPGTLVVGGHYDTKLGSGSPGANDNGSGTVVVLELARCFAEEKVGFPIEFVFFGGEEQLVSGTELHHYGSRYYVDNLSQMKRDNLIGAIIVDMVGVGSQLYARTMGIGPMDLCNRLMAYAQGAGVSLPYLVSGSYSDHEPFENAGIPAVWLEYKDDPWYHTPGDSYDKINPAYIDNTGRLLEGFIRSL